MRCSLFQIEQLQVSGMWLDVDVRMDTKETCVLRRLD